MLVGIVEVDASLASRDNPNSSHRVDEVLGVPEGTARTRLRKAKLQLRGTIDELARTKDELESTRSGLEGWARGLREKLAV